MWEYFGARTEAENCEPNDRERERRVRFDGKSLRELSFMKEKPLQVLLVADNPPEVPRGAGLSAGFTLQSLGQMSFVSS